MIGGKADDVVFVVENAFRQVAMSARGPDLNDKRAPLPVAVSMPLNETGPEDAIGSARRRRIVHVVVG